MDINVLQIIFHGSKSLYSKKGNNLCRVSELNFTYVFDWNNSEILSFNQIFIDNFELLQNLFEKLNLISRNQTGCNILDKWFVCEMQMRSQEWERKNWLFLRQCNFNNLRNANLIINKMQMIFLRHVNNIFGLRNGKGLFWEVGIFCFWEKHSILWKNVIEIFEKCKQFFFEKCKWICLSWALSLLPLLPPPWPRKGGGQCPHSLYNYVTCLAALVTKQK